MTNIVTKKIKYKTDKDSLDIILGYIKNYNNVLRFTYNRFKEFPNLKGKEISALHRGLNNIFIDTHFLNSVIFDAKTLLSTCKSKKLIFGGKTLFKEREEGKISKEEWQLRRLSPLYHVGNKNYKGNDKFQILSTKNLLFKPNRKTHITLELQPLSKRSRKELERLIQLQEERAIPITYKLDLEYIYITYDYDVMKDWFKPSKKVRGRVMAVDLNPNYIGYSVADWKNEEEYKVIEKGVFSLKYINDSITKLKVSSQDKKAKYWHNKSSYEIRSIAQRIVKLANHYGCEIFGIEDINSKTKDTGKGKYFNRLVNSLWNRNLFVQQIEKYCSLYEIKLQKVECAFSSFIGNLSFRDEKAPDMVLSSIEVGRRAYEFYHQYILKDKEVEKNIVFPTGRIQLSKIQKSLEELKYPTEYNTLKALYYFIKEKENSKQRYRVSLEEFDSSSYFRKFYYKQKVMYFKF